MKTIQSIMISTSTLALIACGGSGGSSSSGSKKPADPYSTPVVAKYIIRDDGVECINTSRIADIAYNSRYCVWYCASNYGYKRVVLVFRETIRRGGSTYWWLRSTRVGENARCKAP